MEEYLLKKYLAYTIPASHIKRPCHHKISSSLNILPITEN